MNLEMIRIAEGTEFPVDVRQLHVWLGVGEKFTTWIEKRILECGFDSEIDYVSFSGKPANSVGRPRLDYYISFDMAKELAMLEKNDKGRQARKYFIEAEKKLKNLQQPMDELEMLALVVKSQLEQRASMRVLEASVGTLTDEVRAIKAASYIEEGYVTISGFLSLIGVKNKTPNEIKILGMQVAKYCKENGVSIAQVPSAKYGKVNAYPKEVLEMLIGDAA